jgi:hypothetical protein
MTPTQLETARLQLTPRHAEVVIRAGRPGDRIETRFSGPEPRLHQDDGDVAVAFPRFRGAHPLSSRVAELRLDPSVAWIIEIEGGAARLVADLSGLALRELAIGGGVSDVAVLLPAPEGHVPIRVDGGASKLSISRPPATALALRIRGGASRLAFDDQRHGAIGGEVRLVTPGFEDAADRYAVEIQGGASRLTVS